MRRSGATKTPFQGLTQPKSLFALQQGISVPYDYLAALEHSKGEWL